MKKLYKRPRAPRTHPEPIPKGGKKKKSDKNL